MEDSKAETAGTITIAARREEIKPQQAIEEQIEKLQDGESVEILMSSAAKFAEEVIRKYPQVRDGKLNYYFGGSLAVMLWLKGGRFEVLDPLQIPEIVPIAERKIPFEAAEHLKGFVRKIGDLDFIPLDGWKRSPERMRKGGGGPKLAELSESAKRVLRISDGQVAVMCDPQEAVIPHRVARVKIDGQEFYITEPIMMLAYKAVHLGEKFEDANKTNEFVRGFKAMLKALELIYTRDELLQASHETIFAYMPNFPNQTFVPYHNPKFEGELRKFFDETISRDPDAPYLDKLQYGKERSIGVLKVLHRYQSPEAKQAIVDFFNQHKEQINRWSVNSTSPKNREVIADFLLSRPDLLDDFKTHIEGEPTREVIVEALKTHSWAFDKYGDQIPDRSVFEMRPMSSIVMEILMKLDESNIIQELHDIGYLLDNGMDGWFLDRILGAKFTADKETRRKLFNGLKAGRGTLSDQEFKRFTYMLSMIVADAHYYDSETNRFVEIREEERQKKVISIFEQFGLEYN